MAESKIVFIVGGQRCGTTYLYKVLENHNELILAKPVKPEPKFFLEKDEIAKGKRYYKNKFYNKLSDEKVLIEKSTSYIESHDAATEIKKMFPTAKILILLRNPVDRALSNYFFSFNNGLETRTLADVFLNNKPNPDKNLFTSVSPFDYLERGEYFKYIESYFKLFERRNVGVFIFEELVGNLVNINKVLNFIGVKGFESLPDIAFQKVNSSQKNHQIRQEVIDNLKKYYSEFNKSLEVVLHKDLNMWK